ncbi:general stress protein [Nodosilinea sp. LEGE 07298]|uniref:general stress protein n=1 Tax=Nodosilinea sp. LEGE 07298 TaxID=2777970 RepID=UPI001D15D26B|nr:general stress protein [Nodosilinea sp. LEGE 07298]
MASQHRRAVGIFPDRPRTASALQALSDSGFAMSHVSVIAKDSDRQTAIAGVKVKDEASNQADTGGTVGAVTGGVLGGVTGLLVGLGTLVIPGIGPAMLAGEAAVVLSTLAGGAAGAAAGGLVGALIGMGIPEHRAKHYRDRVAQGDYLVMLKDTEPEIARAERTLKASGIEDWGVYHAPDDTASPAAGSPNATFSGDVLPGDGPVAPGRDNPYNRVDHPMDQGYPHRQGTVPPVAGLPHASNPVEP